MKNISIVCSNLKTFALAGSSFGTLLINQSVPSLYPRKNKNWSANTVVHSETKNTFFKSRYPSAASALAVIRITSPSNSDPIKTAMYPQSRTKSVTTFESNIDYMTTPSRSVPSFMAKSARTVSPATAVCPTTT